MTGTKPPLPTYVMVGPYNIRVELTENVAENLKPVPSLDTVTYGCLNLSECVIYISSKQNGVSTADTLLHEVLHAIWAVVGGWAHDAVEEQVVAMMSTILLDTIRKNKDLIEFLVNA